MCQQHTATLSTTLYRVSSFHVCLTQLPYKHLCQHNLSYLKCNTMFKYNTPPIQLQVRKALHPSVLGLQASSVYVSVLHLYCAPVRLSEEMESPNRFLHTQKSHAVPNTACQSLSC